MPKILEDKRIILGKKKVRKRHIYLMECLYCHKPFYIEGRIYRKNGGRYCHPNCFYKSRQKENLVGMYYRNCNYCGKYYEGHGKFYCSRLCRSNADITKVQIICYQCNQSFEVVKHREKTAKFCSKKCQWKFASLFPYPHNFQKGHEVPQEWRDIASKVHKNKTISEKQRKMISDTSSGRKLSEETKQKMRKPKSEVTKQKIREWQIEHPNKKFKDTGIELKIEEELKKRNINYEKQQPLYKIAIVDFLLPEHKIVIQCDGCYWHGCPIHNPTSHQDKKENDAKQDKVLKDNGYTVYRFWGHEINENVKKCMDSVKM